MKIDFTKQRVNKKRRILADDRFDGYIKANFFLIILIEI